ncbi:MAG: SCO family protein [Kiloniellaceae bacterium]
MAQYLLVFLAGLAGSLHCVGMCGGFACALGRDARGAGATLRRHLLYNVGRVTTYVFLGALAGALGAVVIGQPAGDDPLMLAQRGLALAAGALMIFIGLQFFGFFRQAHGTVLGVGGQLAAQSLQGLLRAPGPAAPLAFGVLNGFLPCPLVYAFLAHTAAICLADPERGVATGALTMAAFGLGTFPAMLTMGWLGRLLAPLWRRRGVWLAGAFILVLGLITIARSALPLGGHLVHAAAAAEGDTVSGAFELPKDVRGTFSLLDHSGRAVSEADFRGRFLLVYFGYTSCPDVCPTELSKVAAALDSLGAMAAEVQPLFITVDPQRDTIELLADYVGHFHPNLLGLTGSLEDIARAEAAFGVHSSRSPAASDQGEAEGEDTDYLMNHSLLTFLIGPEGRHLETFISGTAVEAMTSRVRQHVELNFVKSFLLRSAELSSAYESFAGGDYAAAFDAYRHAADRGHPAAQNNLGILYEVGAGVAADTAQAEAWYRRAAEQGLPMGQYNLGILYGTGAPAARDPVRAYAWLTLARAQGLDVAEPARQTIAGQMTAAQIVEAEDLARRWQLAAP